MTATINTKATTLEITKSLKAPVEKVYKTWTQPEHMKNWFGCAQTGETKIVQDFRVGGEYRYEMHLDSGDIAVVTGTFKEIVENKKVVYTWSNNSTEFPAQNTLVTVEFLSKGQETDLVLKHENFAVPVAVEGHTAGWSAALEKFASLL